MGEITQTSRVGAPRAVSNRRLLALALAGVVASGLGVAIALSAPPFEHRVAGAIARGLMIAVPVGVGLGAWAWRRTDRFAPLLVAVGLLSLLPALAESSNGVLYSIGRVAIWLVEPAVVYLILAYPSGRLTTRAEWALIAAAVLVVAVLFLPTVPLVHRFATLTGWVSCTSDCPANAFALTDSDPAFVEDVVRPLREGLAIVIAAGVVLVFARRTWRAGPLLRPALVPVLAMVVARAAAIGLYFLGRRANPTASYVESLGLVYLLTLPAVALSFGVGLIGWRLSVASALQRLMLNLRAHASARQLRGGMAEALRDPSLAIVHRIPGDPGHWVDEAGAPVERLDAGPGRVVTEVRAGERLMAAIIHDPALLLEPELVEAAARYALVVLENDRLLAEVRGSMHELAESRARIVSVADRERTRIQRDLHDGAQQRLYALRMRLELARRAVESGSPKSTERLAGLDDEIGRTIEEVRGIAAGIYPSLLAEEGLTEALRVVAQRAPLPVSVEATGIGRYDAELESTVYFCCVEALQNATKHAPDATGVTIALSDDGRLRFEVRDDGAGFADGRGRSGTGLTNLRDRVAAAGGELTIQSEPGAGTVVAASIPLER